MPYKYGAPETTLNGAITAAATSLVVTSAAGFPAAPFFCYIVKEGSNTAEVVKVTAKSGTTFTIQRNVVALPGVRVASAHGNHAPLGLYSLGSAATLAQPGNGDVSAWGEGHQGFQPFFRTATGSPIGGGFVALLVKFGANLYAWNSATQDYVQVV